MTFGLKNKYKHANENLKPYILFKNVNNLSKSMYFVH